MSLHLFVATDKLPSKTHLLSLNPPQLVHAAGFVARCDPKTRADLYVRCGDWGKAAEACRERGDRTKLESVLQSPVENDEG